MYYSCVLSNRNKLFRRDIYIPKVAVAMKVCQVICYCSSPLLGFKRIFQCILQCSLYHNIDIGTKWHCALVSCTPSQSMGLVLGCGLFWHWVSWCVPFTNSLIEFYFIMMVVIIIVIFMAILFILNYTFRLFVSTSGSANVHLPGFLHPWTFSLNIGLNMLPSDSFMSFLDSLQIYRGVSGFATDCPCGVWWRGLTTCLLYVGQLFGNLVRNDSRYVILI